ncbi:BRCA1-A complex subunit Abraxas 1 isoform X2 [Salarias fasciatus]|uniref:BRCA1-A complex subunit Abraxas 1-like n=1 Tax=Salarias fasciatus TaxID=181472 RepID=A0A672IET7_SALFA|nr:BRCA1-A complex subunit Abraxas 1-like isoform X2 [Salarias fasciatus]
MAAEPSVRVPGIVFASLAFQHVNADSDVDGLILGESRFDEQVTISDSQSDLIHIQEVYNVQKHVACQRINRLYSSSGQVNMEELQKLVDKQESVIGWYRQRRNSEQQMTFREKLVHESLQGALSNPHLLFLLLTPSQVTPTGSTHKTEYSAFVSRSRRLQNVPVLVANLGQLEQQGYWKVSAPCSAAGYSLTMKKHSSRFFCSDGGLKEVTEVNRMNDTLQEQLQAACRDLERSERQVETLQAQVSALRTEFREKQPRAPPKEPGGAVVQRNNVMLQEAVFALFGYSPLLLTQTVTIDGFPVPLVDVSMATEAKEGRESPASTASLRKRPQEAEPEGRDRKCRRRRC